MSDKITEEKRAERAVKLGELIRILQEAGAGRMDWEVHIMGLPVCGVGESDLAPNTIEIHATNKKLEKSTLPERFSSL